MPKDFSFTNTNDKIATVATSMPLNFWKIVDTYAIKSILSKENLIKLLKEDTLIRIISALEIIENMKTLCEITNEEIEEIKTERPVVYNLIQEAKTQFLTEIVTREVTVS